MKYLERSIPKTFLAKILQKLAKASVVKSYRGMKGGFERARPPKKMSLLDVIEAIQGPVIMNACAVDKRVCTFTNACSIHPVWVEIRKKVEKLLSRKNFADFRQNMLTCDCIYVSSGKPFCYFRSGIFRPLLLK